MNQLFVSLAYVTAVSNSELATTSLAVAENELIILRCLE